MNLIARVWRWLEGGRDADLSPSPKRHRKIGRPHNGLGLEVAMSAWVGKLRDAWMEQDHSDVPDHVDQCIEHYDRDPLFQDVVLILYSKKTGEVEYESTIYKIERCSGDVWCMTGRRAERVSNIYGAP